MAYSLTEGQLDPPADPGVVEGLSSVLQAALPRDYLDFLLQHNGGEGFIGDRYIVFWKAEELADFNREYEVGKYAPGMLLFGSHGGGEAYGFDTRSAAMPIVCVPFIGMELRYASPVAKDFADLLCPACGAAMSNHRDDRLTRGMDLVEIKPIIVGGDPVDPENKTWVTRQQHFELVRFWNRLIGDLRKQDQ